MLTSRTEEKFKMAADATVRLVRRRFILLIGVTMMGSRLDIGGYVRCFVYWRINLRDGNVCSSWLNSAFKIILL